MTLEEILAELAQHKGKFTKIYGCIRYKLDNYIMCPLDFLCYKRGCYDPINFNRFQNRLEINDEVETSIINAADDPRAWLRKQLEEVTL